MNGLVIFDSVYGNTEKIARAIGEGLSDESIEVEVLSTKEAKSMELDKFDLLVVGAPTHGGRASPDMKNFLDNIPKRGLEGVKTSAFDTRIVGEEKGIGIRILTGILGYAAGRIGKSLERKGGSLKTAPEGFIVDGKEGPLKEGEIDRARIWAREIIQALK